MKFTVGAKVVVGPAYSMDSRRRDLHDEITGLTGIVTAVYPDGDIQVETQGHDFAVYSERCTLAA